MDYKEAIDIIERNFPDKSFSMLRKALTFAIRTMNNHYSPLEPEMHSVIINGAPSRESFKHYTDKGWNVICASPAKLYHPYAAETDTILFMVKPINKKAYDEYMYTPKNDECGGDCNG